MHTIVHIVNEIWAVTQAMAPYLLLGFLVAGILRVLISPAFVQRHLGGRGFWPVCKAALLGVPLPLCSCGVLPVAASLHKHGASKGATLAFLVSTPQTGVDCILATQALLGPVFVIFSVVTTLMSGLLAGAWQALGGELDVVHPAEESPEPAPQGRRTLRQGLRFGFVTMPRDIGRAVLFGIALSGILTALVPDGYLTGRLGSHFASMLIMLAVGIPMYVCSSGSIPIAYAFLQMGVTPGAALVFLVTGPATNTTAITTIWKILGRRACFIYLATIAASALVAGALLDCVATRVAPAVAMNHVHAGSMPWWHTAAAVILLAMLLPSCFPRQK